VCKYADVCFRGRLRSLERSTGVWGAGYACFGMMNSAYVGVTISGETMMVGNIKERSMPK